MQLPFCLTLSLVFLAFFSWIRITISTFCQVYPSEYAYQDRSVSRDEDCQRYAVNLDPNVHTHNYIRCNGTHLLLTDSNYGQMQYQYTDYYQWIAGSAEQLLFIFPTRVSLTTITLHYYSDNYRSLPRLSFYAVPDDFDVWYGSTTLSDPTYVEVAAVPPGGEPAGRKNVSINVNFNTKRVLMYKFSSSFWFALSEVEFFTCNCTYTCTRTCTRATDLVINTQPSTSAAVYTTENNKIFGLSDGISQTSSSRDATATTQQIKDRNQSAMSNSSILLSSSEIVAWVLVAILTVLFTGLLSVVLLWMFKKRQARDTSTDNSTPKYEMEGDPCYEATVVKQTTDTHFYEAVRGAGDK